MRIPATLQDKMKLALGLSLVCGNLQCLPELDNNAAEAASPQTSKTAKKQAAKKVEKSTEPAPKEEALEEDCCLQPQEKARAKKGGTAKDPCPACGRG